MNPLISVIVPVYKVENYLKQCVESIVNQTYTSLEIILVDDGSPDKCPQLCDEWANKDSRIRVIHKLNGGLSDARNTGMKIAQGDYISFIDSDDWIEKDMYKILLDKMNENNCDIAACGVRKVWDNQDNYVLLTNNKEVYLNNHQAMEAILLETDLKQPVWYKLYKKNIVNDIFFEKGKYHEDVFWSYQVIGNAKSVYVSDYIGYNYRQRDNSIMGDSFSIKRLDALEAKQKRILYINKNYPDLMGCAVKNMLFSCIYMQQCSLKSPSNDKSIIKKRISLYFNETLKYEKVLNLSVKEKIWIRLAKINFILTCKLRNSLKIGV